MADDGESPLEATGHVRPVVLSWADLNLDPENPRLEVGGDSNRQTLNELLDSDLDKQLSLARDISTTGKLNPLDLIGIVEENGVYVVVEGNRRIASLKMLKSPELVEDPRLRRRIERIAADGTGPDEVTCSLFDDRDELRHWLILRHRGEQEGRGVVPWNPDAQERYSREPGSQSDLARQARQIMLDAYPTDVDVADELNTVFRGGESSSGKRITPRPTTLGRLLKSPAVQKAFGFAVESGDITMIAPAADVHAAFRQMIFDCSEGLTAREINSNAQIQAWINRYPDLAYVPPPPNPPATPSSGSQSSGTDGGATSTPPAAPQPPPPAGPQSPPIAPTPARRRLPREERRIFEGLRLRKFLLRTDKALKEAHKIDIEDMPAVTGVMVRVIVELCVTEAVDKLCLNARESDSLGKKIEAVLKHLDPNIADPRRRDKTLEAAWINSQKTTGDGLGVELMHAFVHGLHATTAPADVRSLSKGYRPMLDRLEIEMP